MPVKILTEDFIKRAKETHNNKYDYSLVEYVGTHLKVKIICAIHGIFEQTPHAHLWGQECPKCKNCYRYSLEEYIERFRQIHGDKYSYSKTQNCKRHNKIIIICKVHGDFQQEVAEHLNGGGCPRCSHSGYTKTKKDFINDAILVHGNKYDYSEVIYINNKTPVEIICKEHGEFWQRPDMHLHNKNGCPKCNESKGEKLIRSILIKYNIKFKHNYKFDDCINPKTNYKLSFDFYLSIFNLCIEFDGIQHFKKYAQRKLRGNAAIKCLKNIQYRDKIKNEFCKNNNIKLIRYNYKQSFDFIIQDLERILQ